MQTVLLLVHKVQQVLMVLHVPRYRVLIAPLSVVKMERWHLYMMELAVRHHGVLLLYQVRFPIAETSEM